MKRGEVWRVRIPFATGHAQTGERPAILVQADQLTVSLPTVLIVPLTSTLTATRFAGTLLIPPDSSNGLALPSVALVFQLRALDKRACLHRLGTVSSETLDQILGILDRLTGR
jgi:mRNA interferase MazF